MFTRREFLQGLVSAVVSLFIPKNNSGDIKIYDAVIEPEQEGYKLPPLKPLWDYESPQINHLTADEWQEKYCGLSCEGNRVCRCCKWLVSCSRCKKHIQLNTVESCFYCGGYLCYDCWEEYGHCGHPEAERQNELAREGKLHNGYVCSNLGCSKCLAPGCESRKCFSGIDHLVQTGYQDVLSNCECGPLEIQIHYEKCS